MAELPALLFIWQHHDWSELDTPWLVRTGYTMTGQNWIHHDWSELDTNRSSNSQVSKQLKYTTTTETSMVVMEVAEELTAHLPGLLPMKFLLISKQQDISLLVSLNPLNAVVTPTNGRPLNAVVTPTYRRPSMLRSHQLTGDLSML
jgi:hypothetical protein